MELPFLFRRKSSWKRTPHLRKNCLLLSSREDSFSLSVVFSSTSFFCETKKVAQFRKFRMIIFSAFQTGETSEITAVSKKEKRTAPDMKIIVRVSIRLKYGHLNLFFGRQFTFIFYKYVPETL